MNTKNVGQGVRNWAGGALLGLSLSLSPGGAALAQVNLAQTPLFLTSSAEPNIMFLLDDSGSMHWEITPDEYVDNQYMMYVYPRAAGNYGLGDYANHVPSFRSETTQTTNATERGNAAALRSIHVNKSYYNPATTYRPWAKPAGMAITAVPAVSTAAERFPDASPTAAPHSPIRDTGVRNLTADNTQEAVWRFCTTFNPRSGCSSGTATRTFYPATYFHFTGAVDTNVLNRDNYQRVEIRATTATYVGHGRGNRSDCAQAATATCSYAEEIQNFANWYTYYRSRMLASQAGIGAAFVTQPEEMRVGFGSINQGSTTIDGVATRTIKRGVRPFSGSDREGFFSELYLGNWPTSGTPLRRALNDAGQYFSRSDNRGPWGAVPGENNTTNQLTCRQSFSILMTDGYWTNDTASQAGTEAARANVDGTNGDTITGPALVPGGPTQSFTYTSATPFTDAHSNTLADVAMYYWSRDLRTDLENRVPASSFNPAFWQHMVTYGVALGVTGAINPNTALGAITSATPPTINWPDPTASNPAKIDDLLHAAVNSRGGFFSAADPDTFANELSGVLDSIVARTTAAGTAAAASSAVLQSDSLLYNASFRSTDWSGNLEAKELDAETGEPGDLAWNAETLLAVRPLDGVGERMLVTRTEGGIAVNLRTANLGAAQIAALAVNPPGAPATTASVDDRVTWLRGDDRPGLRVRTFEGVLRRIGDLIGSDPQYLSKRDFGYSLLPGAEGAAYRTFRSTPAYQNRPDALLVGSNGGFLHAFHARTGQELFAFMPSELLLPRGSDTHAQINELMRPDYTHRYYVDGTATVGDAYVGGAWRTMAVGTMGAGGRTVFALDVTNPASFSETNVRWEFTHADLGFGATKPKIVRLADGRWAAVFGNGVNSATHRPRLFVVDLANGNLIYNIAMGGTGDGSAADPNGLSPVETTDWPANNLSLTNAYAGDLHGNLWRVSFPTPPAAPVVTRLFRAVDSASPAVRQPITARPRVAVKPGDTADVVVLFGTGSFFRVGDDTVVNPQVQSLYGIFDSPTPAGTIATRGNLLTQTITSNAADVIINGTTYPPGSLRFITENTLGASNRGWVINLPAPGERVISEATFPTGAVQDRVRFTTLIPDDDPCRSGRNGFLMDISLLSGGRYESPVFDLDGDGVFDGDDNVGGNPVSGIGGPTGETLTTIRDPNRDIDNLYSGDGRKIGAGRNTAGPVGRQSWRQLR